MTAYVKDEELQDYRGKEFDIFYVKDLKKNI